MDSAQINLINVPFNTNDGGNRSDLKINSNNNKKKRYRYRYKRSNFNKKKAHLRLIHILSSYHYEDGDDEIGQTWYQQHAQFVYAIKKWPCS